MRQLLMLGFYCEVYRREPRCRVYVNDVLLDEFDIPQCDQVQLKMDPLDPLNINTKLRNLTTTNTPFLKYIEFDDAGADSLDVVLKITNDDNNYANGFMSKYTHITLSFVHLISKKVLENIDKIDDDFKFSKKYICNIVNFYATFYANRPRLFENFLYDALIDFPVIQLKSDTNPCEYNIGSSGCYRFSLKKKLGFWQPITRYRGGFWRLGYIGHVKYLYDKYKQYENQRSSNT